MTLTDLERGTALWKKLVDHYTERLATLRAQNDTDRSPEDTASIRGEIKEVKRFLALDREKPEFKSPGPSKRN